MKKILYCMHIGWNWIKQRPHYIAEELSNSYDITVISDHSYRVKSVINKDSETKTLHIKEFYKIPLLNHSRILKEINNVLKKIYYNYYFNKISPDYIYVMTPNAINTLPRDCGSTKIIYDCMDDMVAFAETEGLKKEVYKSEYELINIASLVVVSSQHLLDVLLKRYPTIDPNKLCLVRNGYNGEVFSATSNYNSANDTFTFCYFGTIASWFNFDFFIRAFGEIENLGLLLIGPLQSGTSIPNHPKIKYIGSVSHEELQKYTDKADAFTMPFIVDELIESVDPVKLYEYINFNKNILCVHYNEVNRFSKFVFFYEDYKSFKEQILAIMCSRDVKYSLSERLVFLENNTWCKRAETIRERLENIND